MAFTNAVGQQLLTITGFDVNLSGVLSGAGGVTKNGSGTLTFSGASAKFTLGLTTVNSGTVLLNKNNGVVAMQQDANIIGGTLRVDTTGQCLVVELPILPSMVAHSICAVAAFEEV